MVCPLAAALLIPYTDQRRSADLAFAGLRLVLIKTASLLLGNKPRTQKHGSALQGCYPIFAKERNHPHTGSVFGRPFFSASMCMGVVPQQPPTTCAPIETHSRQADRYRSGEYSSVNIQSGGSKRPTCA